MPVALEHTYTPRGVLRDLFDCRAGEVLVAGPAGTGKSRACLEKLHAMALSTPGMRGLMVRKTLVSLTSTGLVTYREHVAAEAIAAGVVTWYGGSRQEPAAYRYSNGSRLVVGGMDDPTKIMSSEYDVVYAQEAVELSTDDWEKITTRLRNNRVSFQQLLADCNPDAPTHWLKTRADSGKTVMLESRHEDNPTLFDDAGQLTPAGAQYMSKLDNLTGVRYYRLRKGLWVAAEGIIYEDYDPAVHLVDRFKIPDDWPRYWAVDFGFVNPFVLQCWAEDPDGQLILYREIYRTGRTVDQHAADIMECVSRPDYKHVSSRGDVASSGRIWTEPKPRAIVCDHDAEGRATLAKELNLPTRPANKKVKDGIEKVQVRMRKRADGRPGMVIMRDSVVHRDQSLVDAKKPACTAEEIPGYVWDIKDNGKTKDEPVKEGDHGADAMRYLIVYRDPSSRPGMRVL